MATYQNWSINCHYWPIILSYPIISAVMNSLFELLTNHNEWLTDIRDEPSFSLREKHLILHRVSFLQSSFYDQATPVNGSTLWNPDANLHLRPFCDGLPYCIRWRLMGTIHWCGQPSSLSCKQTQCIQEHSHQSGLDFNEGQTLWSTINEIINVVMDAQYPRGQLQQRFTFLLVQFSQGTI